jgi:hypothetical protein
LGIPAFKTRERKEKELGRGVRDEEMAFPGGGSVVPGPGMGLGRRRRHHMADSDGLLLDVRE